jgi:hypothetical protein
MVKKKSSGDFLLVRDFNCIATRGFLLVQHHPPILKRKTRARFFLQYLRQHGVNAKAKVGV